MNKTIGIFAHVDAGKTTFSEQILYHHHVIRKKGRVDTKDAFLDGHDIEKRRGITIFSEQAHFSYDGVHYDLIDTPGHMDFSAEMERAIKVLDYAIIIISGIDGIQSHTETVYELLKEAKVPIFFFVNKLDVDHGDYTKAFEDIRSMCSQAVDFREDYYEEVASHDEDLMTLFFDETFDHNFQDRLIQVIKEQKVMPVMGGSALRDENVKDFFELFHGLTTTQYKEGPLSAYVYKVKYDDKKQKQCFIKISQGSLKVRDFILEDKVTEIRKYQGHKYESLQEAKAGELVAIIGCDLKVGQVIGQEVHYDFKMMPTMKSKIICDSGLALKDLYQALLMLEAEDPTLQVIYSEDTKDIHIGIMGQIQLEILKEILLERFNYSVDFEAPNVIYKETIEGSVIGYGHFEPLKHYAEVHLKLQGQSKQGMTFENKCSTDHLTVGNQNLVKHHIFEKKHRGILTGSELTDIKVTLLTGASHNKHTSGGDFREATIRALRQGLEQAKNVLLEPYYEMKITVPVADMGKILSDIQLRHGSCISQMDYHDKVIISAQGPVSTFYDYPQDLLSQTHGMGRIRMRVLDYRPCHNTEEVIEKIGYDKVTDTSYPSSSVFCSKGKGYTVSWQEAKDHMHCL